MPLEPGTIVVFDRGYTDYKWFASLTEQGRVLRDPAAVELAIAR